MTAVGPDFPKPGDPWTYDIYGSRWPFATKVELIDGAPYWQDGPRAVG